MDVSTTDRVRSLVVICTRNRPDELAAVIADLTLQTTSIELWVVDSSDDEGAISTVVTSAKSTKALRTVNYIRSEPGLTRQRNLAMELLEEREFEFVHFLDDDSRVTPEYVAEMESAFDSYPDAAGMGGLVLNQPPIRHRLSKRVFLLHSRRPGAILPSGRNVIGYYEEGPWPRFVDWLPGCAMSYRVCRLGGLRFDDRLRGYSWGEDFDFSFRMSRNQPLMIARQARCWHNVSPVNRLGVRRLAYVRTNVLHAWVSENREFGMRRLAFWWSVFGEVLLRVIHAVIARDPESADIAIGTSRAAAHIVVRGSRRDIRP